MREADESNVVRLRDYARRPTGAARPEVVVRCHSVAESAQLLPWPRPRAAYPGGIDDLPV